MMTNLRAMLTCRWAARRVQRYLDNDPAAPLDPTEETRLQAHLAECARCSGRVREYQALGQELRRWSTRRAPDPTVVARLHEQAEHLITRGPQ